MGKFLLFLFEYSIEKKMQKILYLTFCLLGLLKNLDAQILRFGSKLDGTGNLVMVDTIFRLETTPQTIYAKLFSKTPIIEDTLFIITKNLHTSNKFVLKRSNSKMDALATLKFKEDGIYKVFVINPKTKQTIASKKLYITSAVNPNVQALKTDYQKQLTAQNQTKTNPQKTNNTVNVKPGNPTINPSSSVKSHTTIQNQTKPSTSAKDDLEDFDDDDDIDADDIDAGNSDADIDIKDDDLSDFDDAD